MNNRRVNLVAGKVLLSFAFLLFLQGCDYFVSKTEHERTVEENKSLKSTIEKLHDQNEEKNYLIYILIGLSVAGYVLGTGLRNRTSKNHREQKNESSDE